MTTPTQPVHVRLALLANPMGPRPRPNADDVADAVAFVDEHFPHYSPIERDKRIRQAADMNMIGRRHAEWRALADPERKVRVA